MRHLTPSQLKDFLSGALLTGGFTVISAGVGMICGSVAGPVIGVGTGLTVGGTGLVALHQWWTKTGG